MAEGHPIEAVAQTGVVEVHHEPVAFGISAPGYVALSMLVVIGIILWKKVPSMIGRMLDAKIATIRHDLDEAAKLRAEAEAQLAEAKTRNAASAGDAAAIVAHAEAEAKQLLAQAEADAAELVARRAKMAEDKIGAAERLAISEVRAKAADAAARAAATIIAERHDADADKVVVDRTIAGLGRPN
ncbi:ATP synthase subunit B [Sphingomonas sp. Leaf357]|uniref:F0F1 ATP synthase subunit B family protein n=1 Tax=Sphingomonas sp. Leaf357 TaxID=1736350 RepID=UPI0006F4660C|nr:ATP synthase subunit B [Sphingomonas sp. Leaf357]KQS04072.1 ATP synthase subunit B [Sphingomonas sp. Leaf357]